MDGRTPSHLPGTADPRRSDCNSLARTARGRAQAGRRPARRREHARQRRHQVPDPVDLVARDVLYRRCARGPCSRRIAQGPGRSRHPLRDSRSAAVRCLRHEHAHLPACRLVEGGSAGGDQVHRLAHRRALRPEERVRPRALPDSHATRPGALAPPHDRLRQRRPYARHLLDAGRRGVPVGALSDPARGQVRPRRDARVQRLLSRSRAHPALQLVHTARLRHLAVLRGGEAHHRQGFRLSQDRLGPGRSGLTGERAPMAKYETTLTRSETVAEGTMAFHFAKPAGFKFTAGQSMNVSLIDPPETAAFLDELAALPRRNPRYRFVGTMVEMAQSSRPWSGETGFLDRVMLERHLKDLAASVYYVAGPPGLVEAMQKMLTEAGVKEDAIHTDEFFGY